MGLEGALGRLVSFLGVSSSPCAWSFSRARARSSEVALSARGAFGSAMRGEWNARACVVLLGTVVPALVWMASAIASKSSRLSRIS